MPKSIVPYVIVVGLSLVGLVALVDAGAFWMPPPAVPGTWVLSSEDPAACSGLTHDAELRIQQSDRSPRAGVDEMRFGRGWLYAHRRHARLPVPIDVCASADPAIEADFADVGETLVGVACCADRCGDCPASTFVPRVDPAGY